jgi:hypothetical protein
MCPLAIPAAAWLVIGMGPERSLLPLLLGMQQPAAPSSSFSRCRAPACLCCLQRSDKGRRSDAGEGGAVYFETAFTGGYTCNTLTVNSTVFSNNKGHYGGALCLSPSAELTMLNTTMTGNLAVNGAAFGWRGISSEDTSCEQNARGSSISGSRFANNVASNAGGALRVDSSAIKRLSISGSSFEGNEAAEGGSMALTSLASLLVSNCSFVGSKASGDGGVLHGSLTSALVSRTVMRAQEGATGSGGAMYWANGELEVADSSITNSKVGGWGAGTGQEQGGWCAASRVSSSAHHHMLLAAAHHPACMSIAPQWLAPAHCPCPLPLPAARCRPGSAAAPSS